MKSDGCPSALTGLNVSNATGTKMWFSMMAAYFDLLRAAVASAAESGSEKLLKGTMVLASPPRGIPCKTPTVLP